MLFTRTTVAFVFAALLTSTQLADAQTPPAPAQGAPAPPPPAVKATVAGKRASCREDAKSKRLRGMDLADSLQLCMAEARVDCVKEAIAKKMPVSDRQAFFKTCLSE